MTESDCEIEYLDEDADIVQQCVQVAPEETNVLPPLQKSIDIQKSAPLLVERRIEKRKKKRKTQEEDSDYDPSEDSVPLSPPASPPIKKKKFQPKLQTHSVTQFQPKQTQQIQPKRIQLPQSQPKQFQPKQVQPKQVRLKQSEPLSIEQEDKKKQKSIIYQEPVLDRKKCNIRIPDYADPLCLPVKALRNHESDVRRLENWNNVCLEHFKHCDTMLNPEQGVTKSSSRTLVLKNLINKQTGKVETTIWSKTSVENMEGDRKSEIFQCVLPRYKEKRVLNNFSLGSRKVRPYRIVDEAILTREEHKDGQALVVYKPREATSAVYKLFDRKSMNMDQGAQQEEYKTFLREMVCCRVCVRCFQTSWRGRTNTDQKKTILCPICGRSYATVYNLLEHFKTHSWADMKKCKRIVADTLADLVGYQYKCRVCQHKAPTIKTLRQHLNVHRGTEPFVCEIGNHLTT